MSATVSHWTPENLQRAICILRSHEALEPALFDISALVQSNITRPAMNAALKRAGFPPARTFLRAPDPVEKDIPIDVDLSEFAPRPTIQKGRVHIVIGDTQVHPGVPTMHLGWIGRYIVEQFAGQDVAVIHLGDHWDMPSLSSYDEGKRVMEGRRYVEDIAAGNEAFRTLHAPIERAMQTTGWKPDLHFLFGNHEDRIARAANDAAVLEGKLALTDCDTQGWKRHPFLEILDLDGVAYSHFFYNPNTGRPYAGENLLLRLKTIGHTFTMGHQQGRRYVDRAVGGRLQHGLVLGTTYLHDEKYLGPQGNTYWRGIVVCHQVEQGSYDPMFVSLDYLCRRYEGKRLAEYLKHLV